VDATATRLAAIASLVPPGSRVADVGTGHGRLARWLTASGVASFCIASDRSPRSGPDPRRMSKHPALELRYGDGLTILRAEDRIDVVVIAGLGAATISGILGARAVPPVRLVLQPQTRPAELRRHLLERGMAIVAERILRERGREYFVLAAEPARGRPLPRHERLDLDDLIEVGPCLVHSQDPLLAPYWRRELSRCEHIRRSVTRGPGAEAAGTREALARRILGALGAPTG